MPGILPITNNAGWSWVSMRTVGKSLELVNTGGGGLTNNEGQNGASPRLTGKTPGVA